MPPAPVYHGPPLVYLQDACRMHKAPRSKFYTHCERPERLRSVRVGLAALYALMEAKLAVVGARDIFPFLIVHSAASVNVLDSELVRSVHKLGHGNDGGEKSLVDEIASWCGRGLKVHDWAQRNELITRREVPDLYLCTDSMHALNGSVGTLLEAVVDVCGASNGKETKSRHVLNIAPRAFVVVRPPGHHCDRETPAGFCFINNVVIAANHAYQQFQMRRIVIFDIDLHHGDGTQRLILESDQDPLFFYGGIHDPTSYPCDSEKGSLEATLQVHPATRPNCLGVCNIPLQDYQEEEEFWAQYAETYAGVFTEAAAAIKSSGKADDVFVIISCGFDASEFENASISNGGKRVPTPFYHRFTRDACAFADKYASGRILSVLEGGNCPRQDIRRFLNMPLRFSDGRILKIEQYASQRRQSEWPAGQEWLGSMQKHVWNLGHAPSPKISYTPEESQIYAPPSFPRSKTAALARSVKQTPVLEAPTLTQYTGSSASAIASDADRQTDWNKQASTDIASRGQSPGNRADMDDQWSQRSSCATGVDHEKTYSGAPFVFLQDACLRHKHTSNGNISEHIERPERLHAVNVGLASLYSCLEASATGSETALSIRVGRAPLTIVCSAASVDIRKDVHVREACYYGITESADDGQPSPLIEAISSRCAQGLSVSKWDSPELFLVPDSIHALNGAVSTLYQAVEAVYKASASNSEEGELSDTTASTPRAFVAVRPPGHHSDNFEPAHFSFVNNVMMAARYGKPLLSSWKVKEALTLVKAWGKFGLRRHHGSGTQGIVAKDDEGPVLCYLGLYDPTAYPCNTPQGLLNASQRIFSPVSPYKCILNVPLEGYRETEEFWARYSSNYSELFVEAAKFIEVTDRSFDNNNDVVVFIRSGAREHLHSASSQQEICSCGFNASEYETEGISSDSTIRVPTSFYHRFTLDACAFANKYASGRIISVLEGGYSYRALISGTMAHVAALAEAGGANVDERWWSAQQLNEIQKHAAQVSPGRVPSGTDWLSRMQRIVYDLNVMPGHTKRNYTTIYTPPLLPQIPTTCAVSLNSDRSRTGQVVFLSGESKRVRAEDPEHAEEPAAKTRRIDSVPEAAAQTNADINAFDAEHDPRNMADQQFNMWIREECRKMAYTLARIAGLVEIRLRGGATVEQDADDL
ncbi:uncharacterized protein PHACADRAFT_29174 [Phanerochaete carnosa HHB-10118-sp]|uniref:Histone deacetylase domain-containing protein n=1 Tax=Phanerochaete carnosa (strain HHB-10118-sp) TaxID=650164 RepID=K5VQY9_PHACS|nr:uncharacterized protein PHACADRAFT_29174 [Phanerochaete carnosa HHB-10118-sp]EKM53863.1 hypothetical protein PHACADRAFT_29174 [Phanerochaete carnosa HHB-10118-sp]